MISEDEARTIVQAYLERQSNGYTFRFYPTEQRDLNDWSMAFECVAENGSVLDGPIILLVDKQTARVRSLDEYIAERHSDD